MYLEGEGNCNAAAHQYVLTSFAKSALATLWLSRVCQEAAENGKLINEGGSLP